MQKLKLSKSWKSLHLLLGLVLSSGALFAQTHTVSGTVVDDKGVTLIGATVRPKSTTIGAVTTDANGKFSIKLPNSETAIHVTYVGYVDQEIPVTPTSNNLTVTLSTSTRSLNEVVVIAYGTQSKKDVTGAVSSVSGATLEEVPAPNVAQQLQGRTRFRYSNQQHNSGRYGTVPYPW